MATNTFARARRFLNYNSPAKWGALITGAAAGVLYIGFLFLLGLFADLLVNQGAIPSFRNLPALQQHHFLQNDLQAQANTDWSKRLTTLGYSPEEIGIAEHKKLAALPTTSEDELDRTTRALKREIIWRSHVYDYLANNVGQSAADLMAERSREQVEQAGAILALDRDIPNAGILSLIIRVGDRFDGRLAIGLARINPWMWSYGVMPYLVGLLIMAVVLAVVRAALLFGNRLLAARATVDAVTRLRRAIYHHTYRLGSLAFRALGPTEAVGVMTRHLEAVNLGLFSWLTTYFREPIKFALLLLFAMLINPWLAIAFLLFALLVWMVGGQIASYFRRQGKRASQKAGEQLGLIQESLMLMRLIKVYLAEVFNQTRVERQLSRFSRADLAKARGEAVYRPLLLLMGIIAALLLLFVIGVQVATDRLSIAGAIMMATALISLYWPLQTWLDQRKEIRRAKDASAVVFEFLDRTGGVGQVVEAEFVTPLAKKLEFDNVVFKEPGTGRKLLDGVSFSIRAGQKVALVGPDDLEKHALVYLIPRFLDPTSGEIRVDNKNLRWLTLDSLRAQIAVVLQHNLVFNDTVANNIGCGDRSFSLPQIIEAAKIAHAHQFIHRLPKGYETLIGELGHPLTVGEQFRIALARAILRDPALLIIEEPLTPLDEETKDLLDDTMARVLPGRTVIFLPHRLSTIRHCDKVFLLYKGRIEASGEHKELLSQNELYRHLQYLEFNEFAGIVGGNSSLGVPM